MKKMKLRLVVFLVVAGVVSLYFRKGKSPSIPLSSKTVTISLREPNTDVLIVEKTLSDPSAIAAIAESLSRAKSSSGHKCASIGTISFHSESGTADLEILPGHNTERYEFRLDGRMYSLTRSSYIDSLVAAGIDREDIRLDEHPDIEPVGADQPATAPESKSEGREEPNPVSERRSQ